MKLPFLQLTQHLSKNLAPLYLISGDEPLLAQEAMTCIREAAHKAGFVERIRISAEGNDWGNLFYSNTQALSLFSTKRLLELDLTQAKFNATTSKILQEYSANPSADIILLIRMNKLDSKSEQASWYKAVDKIGIMIPLWPISLEQLPAWISQRAKKMNLNLTAAATQALARQVEGNLLAASQELEKLVLLHASEPIDENTIEQIVLDNTQFDIFALVDSVLAGNLTRSLHILNNLAAEGTEPTLILWALTRELRTLSELIRLKNAGNSLSALFPKYRIFEKRQPHVRAFLQRHTEADCWNLLTKAAAIDRMIKGADKGPVWLSLREFILDKSL